MGSKSHSLLTTGIEPLAWKVQLKLFWNVHFVINDARKMVRVPNYSLQCPHNERDGVSNHQGLDCLLNRLFMRR